MVSSCLKASSPPPARVREEDEKVPGIQLRGLSSMTTNKHRPSLGFSLPQASTAEDPGAGKDQVFPKTHPTYDNRSLGQKKSGSDSPKENNPGQSEGEVVQQEDWLVSKVSKQNEHLLEDPEAQQVAATSSLNSENKDRKPLWYLTRTTGIILLLQGLFITLFAGFVR